MTLITISSDDYNEKSPVFINGQPLAITIDAPFDASTALLEVLDRAGVPYTPYTAAGGAPTGNVRITPSRRLRNGNTIRIAINGTAISRVVGTYFLPSEGEVEVMANAGLTLDYEVSGAAIPVSISGTPSGAVVGTAYSFTPTVANGSGVKTFSYTGTSLATYGLSFSTITGVISGNVTGSAGTITGTISVTDSTGTASLPIGVAVTTTVPAATAIATVNPTSNLLANQIIQADTDTGGGQGVGQGVVPLSFSAVTQTGTLQARCSSGGGTRGDLQAAWSAATIAATGAQTVNITGVDAGARWFYLDILDSSGTWQNGTVLIGVGDLSIMSGQSLGVYFIFNNDTAWSNAAVKAVNGGADLGLDPNLQYTRIFATSDTYSAASIATVVWEQPGSAHYPSAGAAKYLTAMAAQRGRVQGLVGHVVSGSFQSFWQAAPTGSGNLGYQQLVRVINATGGKYKYQMWWQGHADAESSVPASHYTLDMDKREFATGGVSLLNNYPRANVIRLVNTIPNINIGPYYYGPMRNAAAIRKGAKDWCAAKNDGINTNGVYVEMPGLNLAFDPHPGTIGVIEAAKCWARAAVNDNLGPALTSVARDPALPNDLILTFAQQAAADFQLTGNWWTRVAVYIAGSTLNYIVPSAGSRINSTQLRVTLTAPTGGTWAVGDSFDVMMGAPYDGDRLSDPSGNMIRDNRTGTIDAANGRPFQTSAVAVNAPAISAGATTPTANYPIAYKAPSSINDIVMTSPVYDTVEHLTGFGLPLIGGTGVSRNNQVAANGHGMVAAGVPSIHFARFRTPAAAPSANRYIFKAGGAGLLLNNAMKLVGSANSLSASATSATVLANKVYWAAVVISAAGVVKLYWFNCTDAGQTVQLATGGATTQNYSVGQSTYSISNAGSADYFSGTTGASILEVGVYDTDTIYAGAAGSFTPPSAPLVGNESHLIFYDRTIAANDTAGVQADLVKVA